jgi:glycosyltransferase involved in cell wall biosynthesis
VNIAVYNEETRIERCLDSVYRQEYPRSRLEVLTVDGGSVDSTLDILNRYPVKLLHNPGRTCPAGRMLGFLHATGDLHMYLDADMELCGKNWLKMMVKPLVESDEIVASFPKYAVDKRDPPLTRYLFYHQVPNPVLEFMSAPVAKTIVERRRGYYLCDFGRGILPLTTINLFRTRVLRKVLYDKGKGWGWIDPEVPLLAVQGGYTKFAYVPVGLYHHTYGSIKECTMKITRDLRTSFIPTVHKRKTLYVNRSDTRSLVKFLLWVLYVNALIPETIRAGLAVLRHRDWVFLYRPLVSLLATDVPLFYMVITSDGRRAIRQLTRI